MFASLAIILLILWVVGFIGFHIVGWAIHLLLIAAVISLVIRLVRGKTI